MSFSEPNDPLLTSSLPFIDEHHPAHCSSMVPSYISDLCLLWKLAVFQAHTPTIMTTRRYGHMHATTTHTLAIHAMHECRHKWGMAAWITHCGTQGLGQVSSQCSPPLRSPWGCKLVDKTHTHTHTRTRTPTLSKSSIYSHPHPPSAKLSYAKNLTHGLMDGAST